MEGSSDPPRPRLSGEALAKVEVMAACPQGHVVSVDRGTRRSERQRRCRGCRPLSSEITPSGAPTSYCAREGNTMCGDSASRAICRAESETLRMRGSSMHENREIPAVPAATSRKRPLGRSGKVCGHNPDMHAAGKSDIGVVAVNAGNKGGMRDEFGHGGTVNPPRNRKGEAGSPSPAAMLVALSVGLRTGGGKGR